MEQEGIEGEELRKKLLFHAEFAMKMIKNGHENDIAFYDQKMHEEKQMGLMIESSMQEALDTGEFRSGGAGALDPEGWHNDLSGPLYSGV